MADFAGRTDAVGASYIEGLSAFKTKDIDLSYREGLRGGRDLA